jgi:hypothetical protein
MRVGPTANTAGSSSGQVAAVRGPPPGRGLRRGSGGFLADRPLTHSLQQARILTALFVPLTTMHALLSGTPTDANDYWVQTTSHQHTFIDRTTTRIEGSAARRRQAQHVACLRPRRDVSVTPGGCGNNLSAGRGKEMAWRFRTTVAWMGSR